MSARFQRMLKSKEGRDMIIKEADEFTRIQKLDEKHLKTSGDKLEPKKRGRPIKDSNIMKARTDIKGNILSTEMNVKGGLSDKVKKALKESIMGAIESKIKGNGIRRKIKGRGVEDESDSSKSEDELERESKGIGSIDLQQKNQQLGNTVNKSISDYYSSLMSNTAMSGIRK